MHGRTARHSGFSLNEALFAFGVLSVGLVAILALFTRGISTAAQTGNSTIASVEAQTLLARILTENASDGKRVFLERLKAGSNWIHSAEGAEAPALFDAARNLWWQCRASNKPLSQIAPLNGEAQADENYPPGCYQIVIAVYRDYRAGRFPVAIYTTLVSAD